MKRNGDPLVYLKVIKIILESGKSFYQRDQIVQVYQVIMSFYFILFSLFIYFLNFILFLNFTILY